MLHRVKKFIHNVSLFEYAATLSLLQVILLFAMFVDNWKWYITFMPALIILGFITFLALVIIYLSFKIRK